MTAEKLVSEVRKLVRLISVTCVRQEPGGEGGRMLGGVDDINNDGEVMWERSSVFSVGMYLRGEGISYAPSNSLLNNNSSLTPKWQNSKPTRS